MIIRFTEDTHQLTVSRRVVLVDDVRVGRWTRSRIDGHYTFIADDGMECKRAPAGKRELLEAAIRRAAERKTS